ncbi:hypothetical protein EON67_07895 [archaeon]|nr:MAG: hypothetical protein EON67_07895 [archaeon]
MQASSLYPVCVRVRARVHVREGWRRVKHTVSQTGVPPPIDCLSQRRPPRAPTAVALPRRTRSVAAARLRALVCASAALRGYVRVRTRSHAHTHAHALPSTAWLKRARVGGDVRDCAAQRRVTVPPHMTSG